MTMPIAPCLGGFVDRKAPRKLECNQEEVMISRLTLPWVPDERSLFFACRGKDLADETQYANSASFEGLHRPSFVNAAQMLSS